MAESDSRVYIADENAFDYSPAAAYGELVMLRSPKLAPGTADSPWNMEVKAALRKQLLDYRPMQDYIVPTGDPVKIAFVSMLIAARGERHQFLKWDAMHYRYVLHVLDIK